MIRWPRYSRVSPLGIGFVSIFDDPDAGRADKNQPATKDANKRGDDAGDNHTDVAEGTGALGRIRTARYQHESQYREPRCCNTTD